MNTLQLMGKFEEIKNASTKAVKEKIVVDNFEDRVFKKAITFLLDDMITTNIAAKKIAKQVSIDECRFIRGIEEYINFLTNECDGTDSSVAAIQAFTEGETDETRQFLIELATKKFKLGMSADRLNKAIGKDVIRVFGCQLAHPFSKFADKINPYDLFYATQKLDGHRTICEIDWNGGVTFYTRKGHRIHGLDELQHRVEEIIEEHSLRGVVLDGEIVASDETIPMNKVFAETSKIIRKDGDKVGLTYHVFDFVFLEDFKRGKCCDVYVSRRWALEDCIPKTGIVKAVPVLKIGKIDSFGDLLSEAESKGQEGIMLNHAGGLYVTTRTKDLLKMKSFVTDDLLVVDWFEGTGKLAGMLGGVIVQYGDNTVRVGSGFSDLQRTTFWKNKESIVGKVIEVQYFEETEDSKTKEKSLRFPVFKQIREDKTVADINIESLGA